MKIEKISDSFVNEFDAQAQGCQNDCIVYHNNTKEMINSTMYLREQRKKKKEDQKTVNDILGVGNYCYESRTPYKNIYW